MSDTETESTDEAVAAFLRAADDAYDEYEHGYTDADATLRRLESAIAELRSATESE
jgi:hypothetical protein